MKYRTFIIERCGNCYRYFQDSDIPSIREIVSYVDSVKEAKEDIDEIWDCFD